MWPMTYQPASSVQAENNSHPLSDVPFSLRTRGGTDFARGTHCARPRCESGRIGDCIMKKIEEYLEHASECRTLARTAPPAHREQLEEMALTWEQLAEARRGKIKKQLKMKFARHPSAI
jgi:hypothetical protein